MTTYDSLTAFIAAIPKAELHIHLEGAVQPETVLALAQRHEMLATLPATDLAALKRWFSFSNFDHFVTVYLTIQNLLRAPEDFALIAYECGVDMAAQHIRYREVTVTPFIHTDYQSKGLTISDIMAGLESGRQQAKNELGVEIRWVFDIPRNLSFPQRDGVKPMIPIRRSARLLTHCRRAIGVSSG